MTCEVNVIHLQSQSFNDIDLIIPKRRNDEKTPELCEMFVAKYRNKKQRNEIKIAVRNVGFEIQKSYYKNLK
jgi:hypothetical protein